MENMVCGVKEASVFYTLTLKFPSSLLAGCFVNLPQGLCTGCACCPREGLHPQQLTTVVTRVTYPHFLNKSLTIQPSHQFTGEKA